MEGNAGSQILGVLPADERVLKDGPLEVGVGPKDSGDHGVGEVGALQVRIAVVVEQEGKGRSIRSPPAGRVGPIEAKRQPGPICSAALRRGPSSARSQMERRR